MHNFLEDAVAIDHTTTLAKITLETPKPPFCQQAATNISAHPYNAPPITTHTNNYTTTTT